MLHSFFSCGGIKCTCVIISWDAKCQASEEWINRMNIQYWPRGTDQPFYHVLTDNGSSYVAEGNYWNCRYFAANLYYINVCLFTRFVSYISYRPQTCVKLDIGCWCVLWWIWWPKVHSERRDDGDVPGWRGRRFISARKIAIISFTFHVLCSRVPFL